MLRKVLSVAYDNNNNRLKTIY